MREQACGRTFQPPARDDSSRTASQLFAAFPNNGRPRPYQPQSVGLKGLMGESGLDRLFITGVSPMVMSDVTSGLNIAANLPVVYPVRLHRSGDRGPSRAAAHREDGAGQGRRRTGPDLEAVYNPTLVLYFIRHLLLEHAYPRQMLDANLAADEGKLDYLAEVASGRDAVIDIIRTEEPLEVPVIHDRFTLRELLERSAQDESFLGAYAGR